MSVDAHHAAAAAGVRCVVLTVSDTRTLDTDTSGRAIADGLTNAGHVVVERQVVPDDAAAISAFVREHAARGQVRAIITTGGTGVAARDITLEAVGALFDKRLDGFGEIFRQLSFAEIGPAAMLSRAAAGVVSRCAVFVLPGSEKAVRLAMDRLVIPELGHIVRELSK